LIIKISNLLIGIGAAVEVRKQVEKWQKQYHTPTLFLLLFDYFCMYFIDNVLAQDAPAAPRYASIFLEKLPALKQYPNFCLAGLAYKGPQGYPVYSLCFLYFPFFTPI
jgi:hypothetical protein